MKKVRVLFLSMIMPVAMTAQIRTIEFNTFDGISKRHNVEYIDNLEFIQVMNSVENIDVNLNGREAVISWNSLPDATSYEVYHSTNGIDYYLLGTTEDTFFEHEFLPKGENYYAVKAIGQYMPGEMTTTSTPVTIPGEKVNSGIYFGLVSYSNKVSSTDISMLDSSSAKSFSNTIDNLTSGPTTALYLGLDSGIDLISNADLPDDLINLSVITFTDGLENWSLNLDDRFDTPEDFLSHLQSRIRDKKYSGLNLNSYTVGLRGTNVTTAQEIQLFKETLKNLASKDEYAYEANNIAEVNQIFQEIASGLVNSSSSQQVTLVIPGQPDATQVRFTFDNVSDATLSNCFIEGTYNHLHHSLDNITSKGLILNESGVVDGEITDEIFVTYNFSGIQSEDGGQVNMSAIQQWSKAQGSDLWQVNSEFTPDDDMQTNIDKRSAAIVLVLDCSTSLGDDFTELKRDAISFINTLIR